MATENARLDVHQETRRGSVGLAPLPFRSRDDRERCRMASGERSGSG
jgi:hypothetical protein